MLGTGDISITNLFYANNSFTGRMPQQVINGRLYAFAYGDSGSNTPTIYEIDNFGTILRQTNMDSDIVGLTRNGDFVYNPKDNYFYVVATLKATHPDNPSGLDGYKVLIKIDASNFNFEIVCPIISGTPAVGYNRWHLYHIIDNLIYGYAQNNNNTTGGYFTIDITTGVASVTSPGNGGRWKIGSFNNVLYNHFINPTFPDTNGQITIWTYDFNSDINTTEIFELYPYVNPKWAVSSTNLLGVSGIMVANGLIYFPITPRFTTEDKRLEILVFNLSTKEFVNRLIGSASSSLDYGEYFFSALLEDFRIYTITSNNNRVEFYSPEVTQVNTILTVHDGNLLNPKKVVKTPPVPIMDYPVKFDATKLVTGTSNEYGEVDGSGNVLSLKEYNGGGNKLILKAIEGTATVDPITNQATLGGTSLLHDPDVWIPRENINFYIALRVQLPSNGDFFRIGLYPYFATGTNRIGYGGRIRSGFLEFTDYIDDGHNYYYGINKPSGVVNIIHLKLGQGADKIYIEGVEMSQASGQSQGLGGNNLNNLPAKNFLLSNIPKFERFQMGLGNPDIVELNNWLTNGD